MDLPQCITKVKLRIGEVNARQKDMTILKWHNKRDVLMINTCHEDKMMEQQIEWEQNQLASFHSLLRKSLTWFKTLALLCKVAVVNSSCK